MLFDYQPYERLLSAGEQDFIYRPEITLILFGRTDAIQCQGLVDTGSDNTIFPISFCAELDIPISNASIPAKGFGGQDLPLAMGNALFALEHGDGVWNWKTNVMFFDFECPEDESVVLGHSGFLEFFTATFDGENRRLSLLPNSKLPVLGE